MNLFRLVAFAVTLAPSLVFSQTIIINEISQGESGSKEYIELLVVDTSAVYNCSQTTPPSIDIRNWIIDDNSGYHGGDGVAPGAVRFSSNSIWSAVPIGTIILLYNDADFNPEISDGAVNLADGSCKIVAPISDAQLFEGNATTPGAVACSYPSSGWTAGGDWSNISMRNNGDCARIVDLNGCEVFSLCYGDVNQNTEIYFNESGAKRVFFFNDGNPENQSNWTSGCANLANCGSQDQTPGEPNNTANQNYIAQFNNNCTPITPIESSISIVQQPTCDNDGILNGSASGSIPGYTYQWFNSDYSILIDSQAEVNSLSAGAYHLVATSSIGCSDTSSVFLQSLDPSCDSVPSLLVADIPNVFSPNADGVEDLYFISTENASSIDAVILNRWGNVVKSMSSLTDAWDGTFNGLEVSEGTYFIKYRIVGIDDSTVEGHTFLQLIR